MLVGAERTGTSLLGGLIGSHPDAVYCGELFNPDFLASSTFPEQMRWAPEEVKAADLRASDPARFLARLVERAAESGYRAVGSKVLYSHTNCAEGLRDYLASARSLRVIHLKRRNLLRRLLSEKRARATGVWWVDAHEARRSPQPRIALDIVECLQDFSQMEAMQVEHDALFKDHDVLEMYYEDVAPDPPSAGTRAAEFLGLDAGKKMMVWSAKTGVDTLDQAIANYSELREDIEATLLRWGSFFDE
ncbi:MAG: sulfotransferase [Propylenella sp.]